MATGSDIYQYVCSPAYLQNYGAVIHGFNGAKDMVRAPIIDVYGFDWSISWGASEFQRAMGNFGISKLLQNKASLTEYAMGTTVQGAATIQVVNGYNLPEFSISLLIIPQYMPSYLQYIHNLIALVSPPGDADNGITLGLLKAPMSYTPPSQLLTTKSIASDVPLKNMCKVMLGTRIQMDGLVVNAVNIQPSGMLDDNGIPIYLRVTVRLQGGRALLANEYQDWFNY